MTSLTVYVADCVRISRTSTRFLHTILTYRNEALLDKCIARVTHLKYPTVILHSASTESVES